MTDGILMPQGKAELYFEVTWKDHPLPGPYSHTERQMRGAIHIFKMKEPSLGQQCTQSQLTRAEFRCFKD